MEGQEHEFTKPASALGKMTFDIALNLGQRLKGNKAEIDDMVDTAITDDVQQQAMHDTVGRIISPQGWFLYLCNQVERVRQQHAPEMTPVLSAGENSDDFDRQITAAVQALGEQQGE